METFVIGQSGQVIDVLEVVQSFIAASTKRQQALNNTVAAAIYRAVATLVFGVTGVVVMVQ